MVGKLSAGKRVATGYLAYAENMLPIDDEDDVALREAGHKTIDLSVQGLRLVRETRVR